MGSCRGRHRGVGRCWRRLERRERLGLRELLECRVGLERRERRERLGLRGRLVLRELWG